MIRDPSDGSVRNPHGESPSSRSEQSVREAKGAISGLPLESTKPERQARTEKSRRELENYRKTGSFHRTTADPSTAVRSSKTEE